LDSAARFSFGLQFVSVARLTDRAKRRDFNLEPARQTEISLTNGVYDHLIDNMVKSSGSHKLINEICCALCQIANKCLAFAARRMTEYSPFAPVAAANARDQSCGSALLRFEIASSNSLTTGRVDWVNFCWHS
jgi:hypothetical protein